MVELLVGVVAALTPVMQEPAQPQPQATETGVRFEQVLSIGGTAAFAAQPLKVSLREWVVRNQQKASITAAGVLVVQLRAGGPVVTVVNGQRTERQEDEFFVVPAGAVLAVETGRDTAVFTVLEVQR